MNKPIRGLSPASWYNDLLKASHPDHPPYTLKRKRQPRTEPRSDRERMENVCRMVDIYRKGWLTPANGVAVLRDILR